MRTRRGITREEPIMAALIPSLPASFVALRDEDYRWPLLYMNVSKPTSQYMRLEDDHLFILNPFNIVYRQWGSTRSIVDVSTRA